VAHRATHFKAPRPLSPWGHGRVSSGRWASRGVGSTHAIQAACQPDGLVSEPRGRRVGLAATTKLGERS
jgi:hypothetical protein